MINYWKFFFVQEYQNVVDAEWEILYRKLEKIVESGAKVVLSKLPIGDVATQYFADRYAIFYFFKLDYLIGIHFTEAVLTVFV